jgi:hypothetical protein
MARRRQKSWLQQVSGLSLLTLLINPVTLMVCVSVIAILLWNRFHQRLDLPTNRNISQQLVHVNPPPEWIKTDICSIAIRESRLDDIQLGEPRAVEMVAASFAVQPWVKRVNHIRKTPAGLQVDLQYRHPVALVEIGNDLLFPVDDEGVVLDSRDFDDPAELDKYWRIWVPQPQVKGLAAGQRWDDLRVTDSIRIANAWESRQSRIGLIHIVNRSQPTRDRERLRYYELWTLHGTKIIWGNPPGQEVHGEASAREKIAAIESFVQKHGPLDQREARHFDVRGGILVISDAQLAREDADFVKSTF